MATQLRYESPTGTQTLLLDDSGNLTIAGTFTAGAIAPSSLALTDGEALILGTGSDDTISHDGTDSLWTHTTGNLVIDNTLVTGKTIFRLGTDTTATAIEFRNNSDAACWTFLPGSASLGYLRGNDNSPLVLGTGNDDIISHDATNSKWTHATGDLTFDNTNTTGRTYMDLGTNTSATSWGVRGNGGSEWFQVDGAGTISQRDAAVLLQKGATTTPGRSIHVIGPDLTHGMKRVVFEATVTPAAVETALLTLPANSCVESTQMNVEADLTGGGTTVTAGIGITGDVDAYGTLFSGGVQADLLTKNAKGDFCGRIAANAGASLGVFSPAAVSIKLIAAATGGASAGDTALTVGSVKVRIVYTTMMSIADAP